MSVTVITSKTYTSGPPPSDSYSDATGYRIDSEGRMLVLAGVAVIGIHDREHWSSARVNHVEELHVVPVEALKRLASALPEVEAGRINAADLVAASQSLLSVAADLNAADD